MWRRGAAWAAEGDVVAAVAAVDLAGLDAEPLAGVAARPGRGEHPIVAAEEAPRPHVGPRCEQPRLLQCRWGSRRSKRVATVVGRYPDFLAVRFQ